MGFLRSIGLRPRRIDFRGSRALRLAVLGGLIAAVPLAGAEGPSARGALIPSPEPGWPQFRGPRRDGVSDERGLLPAWPEGGPKPLWSVTGAGRGFSSPIVVDDRIYLTGDFGAELHVLAYDLNGKRLWRAVNG